MKNRLPEILAVLSIGMAILFLFHQRFVIKDTWFNWRELRNHESIIVGFSAAAIGLLLGKYLVRR
jgi:hypothetical protein